MPDTQPPGEIRIASERKYILKNRNKMILLSTMLVIFFSTQPVGSHPTMASVDDRLDVPEAPSVFYADTDTADQRKENIPGHLLASAETAQNQPPEIVTRKVDEDLSGGIFSLWQWYFNAGYRHDEIDWSFALPNINIRSELQWRSLESIQFEFGLQRRLGRNFRLKGSLDYAFLFDGDNQDSDYDGNNRTDEFSRSNNSTQDGDLWDISIGLAYDTRLFNDRFIVSPAVGYSYHDQNLQITRGVQTIPPLGPFPGLRSSYDPTWYGPWVGAEFLYNSTGKSAPKPGYEAFIGIEYHFADFEAQADWNLRADLAHPVSFRQNADGSGWVLRGGFNYLFNPRWSVNLIGKYQKWETSAGSHRFFFYDGSSYEARLNGVNWDSFSLSAGITCRF